MNADVTLAQLRNEKEVASRLGNTGSLEALTGNCRKIHFSPSPSIFSTLSSIHLRINRDSTYLKASSIVASESKEKELKV